MFVKFYRVAFFSFQAKTKLGANKDSDFLVLREDFISLSAEGDQTHQSEIGPGIVRESNSCALQPIENRLFKKRIAKSLEWKGILF